MILPLSLKTKHNCTLFLFLLLPLLGFSSESMEVSLSTQNKLYPTYLGAPQNNNPGFGEKYSDRLRAVLQFDLSHNGYMQLLPLLEQYDNSLKDRNFDAQFWGEKKLAYVLRFEVNAANLFISVFSTTTKLQKHFHEIPLSGHIEIDRQKIHRFCDILLNYLLGVQGISSLKILYAMRTENPEKTGRRWLSEIWMRDADGHNPKQITFENNYCVHPLFIPQSSDFLYISYRLGQPKIFRAKLDNPISTRQIVSLRGNQLLPALSLDAAKLAFISDAGGRPDLFLQMLDQTGRAKGKPLQLFSMPRATQASPTFSPDGSQMAFVSDKDGPPRIYVMNIPKAADRRRSPTRLLTTACRQNTTPAWSPDGTKLAYNALINNVRQIWIYDFISGEETQLTFTPLNKENPIWAPNSLHIIYNTEDNEEADLYIINLNQKTPERISFGDGRKRFPVWEYFENKY